VADVVLVAEAVIRLLSASKTPQQHAQAGAALTICMSIDECGAIVELAVGYVRAMLAVMRRRIGGAGQQRKQLKLQMQRFTQAALSLLLTAVKLPQLRASSASCSRVGQALCSMIEILDTLSPPAAASTGQEQQQRRLQEPRPAVMVLAGRYLLMMSDAMQALTLAGDPNAACEWLDSEVKEGNRDSDRDRGPLSTLLALLTPADLSPAFVRRRDTASTRPSRGTSSVSSDSSSGIASSSSSSSGEMPEKQRQSGDTTGGASSCSSEVYLLASASARTRELCSRLSYSRAMRAVVAMLQSARTDKPFSTPAAKTEYIRAQEPVQRLVAQAPAMAFAVVKDCGTRLQHLGQVLCAQLPTRYCCNNPRCSNLTTASEAFGLVRGKACACAGCLALSEGPAPPFCFAAR
jgi:hypothetical protein